MFSIKLISTILLVAAAFQGSPARVEKMIDRKADALKKDILRAKDIKEFHGKVYYVSASDGDDSRDGLSPENAICSIDRICGLQLERGDAVLFKRGDTFRGHVRTRAGVTYAAYGRGEKPRIYGSPCNAAREGSWTRTGKENVWVYSMSLPNDVGTLVLDDAQAAFKVMMVRHDDGSTTHIDTGAPFAGYMDLERDLDFYHDYKGTGLIYLCSRENPAERFHSIELLEKGHVFYATNDVRIDNLTIMYCGSHGIGSGTTTSLEVTNCVLGWIGGAIQGEALFGRNHPTRYGNAIEVYGGCDHFLVDHCWIYQAYDAGITHQYGGPKDVVQKDITYSNNLVEDCVYAIEYFLGKGESDSAPRHMENVHIEGNVLRRAGYGWGRQRPDKETPAIIKSWRHWDKASGFIMRNNIFDRSTHYLLNISAGEAGWMPAFEGNTYVQEKGAQGCLTGMVVRSYPFDEDFPAAISGIFGEKKGRFSYSEQ